MNASVASVGVVGQLSTILIGLISAGALLRLILCFLRMATDEEQRGMYLKRARHTITILILSVGIWVLKDLAILYYSH